jgi:copper chaperone
METLQFKTTIKCAGCLAKVTPFLNDQLTPEEWNVDILTPAKILTVNSDKLTAEEVEEKVKQAGFQIERINDK